MANIIKPKRSTVAAKVPTTAQMSSGEIAVNSTDQKIYTYDGTNILQIGAGKLSGLGDVALTGLTSGQTVQWNGTNWINTTPATTDTASQILTKLLTVDGAGSGLDADLLDGLSSASYVQAGSVIMNTNPFGGRQLYINSIDNAMYAANKKWYVTVTTHLVTYLAETYPKLNPAYVASYTVGGSGTSFTVTGSPADIVVYNNDVLCAVSASPSTQYNYSYSGGTITFGATVTGTIYVYPESTLPQYLDSPVVSTLDSNLPFDGSYDSQTTIPVGHYAKIRVVPSSDAKGGFPGYPYGQYFLSYYYSSTPDRAECRTYNRNFRPHTIGWKLASFTDYIGNNAGAGYIQSVTDSGNFGRTIVEFIVFAHASHSTALSEIDWKLDRPNLSTTGATVTKFGSNKLYADLTLGNQTTNTISLGATTGLITGSQFSSTVATGTAPLSVASTTRVSNLNVATAGTSDALNTANNYQVNSIGIGAAASAVAGRINSTTAIITPNITGVSTGLTVVNGDITAYRSGGTTGVLYLNSAGTRYLYWDGTNYNMPGGPVVATNITAAGNITGTATNVTGTVALANGGTGATDAATARTNLGAYAASNPSGYTTNTGTVTSVAALTLGTAGTDVASTVATSTTTPVITLNIPTASATNRGALSSADWTTFNNKTSNLGTVTNVAALTLGTAGTDVASTVATGTTTPVITLNIPTASATNRGALSSTDWSTFNNKQSALVSGTNIKTVNGTSLLGSGDLVIAGGGGGTSVTTGTAAPGTATAGDLWWNSEEGKLKIYYNDGDTSQWVDSYIGVKGDIGPQGIQGIQGIQGNAGAGIPVGGTTGQALVKTSATDYATQWATVSATPAGSTTQIQYNDAGAFAGSANFTYNNIGGTLSLLGTDPEIVLNGITTEPPTPAAGTLGLYTKNIGGRMMLKQKGPSGLDTPIQSSIYQNKVALWSPPGGSTTVPGVWGFDTFSSIVASGSTATTRTVGATNVQTRARRIAYVGAAATNNYAGIFHPRAMWTVGNTFDLGGFYFVARFALPAGASNHAFFVGLGSSISTQTNGTGVDPATLTNSIGIGASIGDFNMRIMYGGSSAQTPIATNNDFDKRSSSSSFELIMYAPPTLNNTVYYRLSKFTGGTSSAVVTNEISGTITGTAGTAIPSSATFLTPRLWTHCGATTVSAQIDIISIYLETDY